MPWPRAAQGASCGGPDPRLKCQEMDARHRLRDVASELLSHSTMPEAEVDRRTGLAGDVSYWRALAPALSVGRAVGPMRAALDDAASRDARRQLAAQGYCCTPPVLDGAALARINDALLTIAAAGWPPVFLWVYDELWSLAHLPDVRHLVTSRLGPGYSQIPHIWTHVVPPVDGSSGWMPHFDGPADGRMSIWIALTDATVNNGCIHVVPRSVLPASFVDGRLDTGSVSLADALRALQGVRALPAARGSVLGWGFDVLHWGGVCANPGEARRAVSMEFVAAKQTPRSDERPLLALDTGYPDFASRLRMIAGAIATYEKFEPGLIRFRALAGRLV